MLDVIWLSTGRCRRSTLARCWKRLRNTVPAEGTHPPTRAADAGEADPIGAM